MAAPHFVFFITDQQRSDWLGCYGHPVVKTPHIDQLAKDGTRFSNFHTASPVCMPNRASLMTGRYPSVHGLRYNGCTLPLSTHTFVDVLAVGGYKTASIGKSHLQPFTGLSPPHQSDEGKQRTIEEARKSDGGDYTLEEPEHYTSDDRFEIPLPYYGFQHVDMVTGHGVHCGGHYLQWLKEQTPDWAFYLSDESELPHNYSCPQVNRTRLPEALYPTSYIRDRAIEHLSTALDSEQPSFTFISFPDPHHPWNPPGKYWDMYSPSQFDVTLRASDHQNPPPHLQFLQEQFDQGIVPSAAQMAFMANDQEIKEAKALTAGMVSMIDGAIGEIVATINASPAAENTVICMTSDHGDYLGDFNLLLKGSWPKASICQVPFIWTEPSGSQTSVSDALCSTIDISATILARAGLEPFNGLQGKSLLPLMDDTSSGENVRDSLMIEMNDLMPRFGLEKAARVRQVLKDGWSLTLYGGEDWGELYDRSSDPNECHNLWNQAAYAAKQSELLMALTDHLIQQMDESPRAQRYA